MGFLNRGDNIVERRGINRDLDALFFYLLGFAYYA